MKYTPYPYQAFAEKFVLEHKAAGLFLDMGLGKTLQMIAVLLSSKQDGRTSLVVCPASLVYNWQEEVIRFAPTLRVTNYVDGQRVFDNYGKSMIRTEIEKHVVKNMKLRSEMGRRY